MLILIISLLSTGCKTDTPNAMNQQQLEAIVKTVSTDVKGEKGYMEFTYEGVEMSLISDVTHNRMRIIAPIAKYEDLTQEHIDKIMEANFHSGLDGRYAVSNGVLFATYIHPLEELTTWQIQSALHQVANLFLTFGSSYTSGGLEFGRGKKEEKTLI